MPDLIEAPDYRASTDENTTCGRCRFGATGMCRLYNFPYLSEFTCNSWANGVQENPRNGVMIALMVPRNVGEIITAGIPDPLPLDELHLTLGYLGNVNDQYYGPQYLLWLIQEFAGNWYEISGRINGVGRFNEGDGESEAFYASFDHPWLAGFRYNLVEFLAMNGVVIDTHHGFTPHITLAYIPQDAAAPVDNLDPTPLTFSDITIGWGDRLYSAPLLSNKMTEGANPYSWPAPHLPYDAYEGNYFLDLAESWRANPKRTVVRAWGPDEFIKRHTDTGIDEGLLTAVAEDATTANNASIYSLTVNNMGVPTEPGLLARWGRAILDAVGLGYLTREIKDVDAWDGSASRWDDAAAYCDACLINLNGGDRAEWSKALCKMPVREPGDGSDVYVRQAVHAAAGRFNQLSKPSSVSESDWSQAVSDAAKQLVKAYKQMDEDPPQMIMDASRKRNIPDNRRDLLSAIVDALADMSQALGYMCVLHAIQQEGDDWYAIMICEGKLYRAEIEYISIQGDEVIFGEWEYLPPVIASTERTNSLTVSRAADGRYHYTLVSATPFLNRVGEIDSTQLFDSFIDHARSTGDYPRLDFLHFMDDFVLGRSYFLERIDLAYVEMGWFDETPVARSFAQAIMDEPVYWGNSIQYTPTVEPVLEEVADGIFALVYRGGIHRFTSLLPEKMAANLFTMAAAQGDKDMKHMTEDEFDAFMRGTANMSEEQRAAALERIRSVNRAGASGQYVFRATTEETATADANTEVKVEINLDEAAAQISDDLTERMTHVMRETVDGIAAKIAEALAPIVQRLGELEADQQNIETTVAPVVEEHTQRQADKPAGRQGNGQLFIPRLNRTKAEGEGDNASMAETAAATTQKIFKQRAA